MRERVAAAAMVVNSEGVLVKVTIGAGLASLPDDGTDAAELFALADERLFQAKREGRNRVVACEEAGVS